MRAGWVGRKSYVGNGGWEARPKVAGGEERHKLKTRGDKVGMLT